MNIGVSLPVEYLSGIDTSHDTEILRAAFGPPERMLATLRARGVTAIEIKAMLPHTAPGTVVDAYEAALSFGMSVVLHGYLPPPPLPERLEASFPPFIMLFDHLRRQGADIIMVVHAFRDREFPLAENRGRTEEVLRELGGIFTGRGTTVRLALELNRAHGRPDPSITWAGVTDMLTRAARPADGICLDMGHASWNMTRGGLAEPPPAFLARVIHTHIHDIGPNATHYPLSAGQVDVAGFVRRLRGAGYAGA
ncbi:MAG: TIM barrel protein [Planctomycetota bacterium]